MENCADRERGEEIIGRERGADPVEKLLRRGPSSDVWERCAISDGNGGAGLGTRGDSGTDAAVITLNPSAPLAGPAAALNGPYSNNVK